MTNDDLIIENAKRNPDYCPYCLRCSGLVRMRKVEPFSWRCDCGAKYDARELVASKESAHA